MSPDETVAALLAKVNAAQARLRDLLAGHDEALLAVRPPSGKWSVNEQVRHLLFAEQAHLGKLVAGGRDWSPLGYTPAEMLEVKRTPAASDHNPPVREVLAAWRDIHVSLRAGIVDQDTPEVRKEIAGHFRHLCAHIRAIQRLLR